MRETWYVLDDGSAVDPHEVAPNSAGRLAHVRGQVAMREDGETPRSRSVEVNPAPFGGKGDHDGDGRTGGAKVATEMKPEPNPTPRKRQGYKTRGR